jgi:hypothetical protein
MFYSFSVLAKVFDERRTGGRSFAETTGGGRPAKAENGRGAQKTDGLSQSQQRLNE